MGSDAVAPEWDAQFAQSRVHGETAQKELLREVVKMCRQRRTAIDVGAHIGLWSRNLAPHFESVYAFEPVPENFGCLCWNTRELDNVTPYMAALGECARSCDMVLPKHPLCNSGCWHSVPGDRSPVFALDSREFRDVDLLKIDVEGAEGLVVRGAIETLQKCKPVVVFEDNGLGPKYYGADWVDPKPLLASLGYTLRLRWRKDQVWTVQR